MKVWVGFSADHSAKLRIVGEFKNLEQAQQAEDKLKYLIRNFRDIEPDIESLSGVKKEEIKRKLVDICEDFDIYGLWIQDAAQFPFFGEDDIEREDNTITIETDELEIQALIKVLLHYGAKIEVYSKHDYP